MKKSVIMHAGKAHFDEVLAVSLILSREGDVDIYRRNPTQDELDDPNVFCVDVGMRYEPNKRNFDHHQADLPASFVLVSKYYGIEEIFENFEWFTTKSDIDIVGPYNVAKNLNIDATTIFKLGSPIESFIIGKFEEDPNHISGLLKDFGDNLFDTIETIETQFEKFGSILKIKNIGGLKIGIMEDKDTRYLALWDKKEEINLDLLVVPDDRGTGLALIKQNNSDKIDLFLLEKEPAILFAHKGGFIAKTNKLINDDELEKLIQKTIK